MNFKNISDRVLTLILIRVSHSTWEPDGHLELHPVNEMDEGRGVEFVSPSIGYTAGGRQVVRQPFR